ncbi:MAG: Ig-like domain-containing protein [Saprospiraceae bacterium]|nr:Ig-like domain-containing protein [Saprospiraceae bacterium]
MTSSGGHYIRGPLAVGGNLVLNNSTGTAGEVNKDNNGTYVFPGDGSTTTGLLVNGSVTWTAGRLRVMNSKYIHIGNSTGSSSSDNGTNSPTFVFPSTSNYFSAIKVEGSIDQTPSPAVFQTSPFDLITLFDNYKNNSFGLSNCTGNVQLQTSSGVNISGNTVGSPQVVYINSLVTGVNHLKLTTASLSNITGFVFQGSGIPSSTKTLVITLVPTGNYTWNTPTFSGISSANSPYIMWNYSGGTTYTISVLGTNTLYGTIFAPNFNITKSGTGTIYGGIIAKTLSIGSGNIYYYPFNASVPNCCTNLTSAGSITGDESGVCGYDAASTVNVSSASGGSGTLEYRWDQSTNNGSTWQEISGASATTYNPGVITTNTQFRRKARRRGCNNYVYSNIISKTVTPIGATISGNANVCPGGSVFLTASSAGAGGSYLWSSGETTESITVTPGSSSTYTVTVTTSIGCVSTASKTVSEAACSGTSCFISSNSVYVTSDYAITYATDPVNNTLRIRTTLSKNYVDNTYGTNSIGWPGAHTFADLTGSDNITLALYDGGNVKKMEFKIDYLSGSASAPSGYKSLGVSGGDGVMILGSVTDVVSAITSMDVNLNQFNYVLTTNSPLTDSEYDIDPSYPNWIYDVWYEVEVKLSALGSGGFGNVVVSGTHASPSKTGNTTESVASITCCNLFEPQMFGVSIFCAENPEDEEIGIIDGGYTYVWSTGETTNSILVNPGNTTFTVTVTNSEGCTKVLSKSMSVKPCVGQLCFNGTNDVSAKASWSIIYGETAADDIVKVRVTMSKNFTDNTYGTNAIGWPSGHTFSNLLNGDNVKIALYDTNDVNKIEFKLDYLSASGLVTSGYTTLGVSGGDGSMLVGNASDVVSVRTSLDVNLNDYGYVLTTNSPSTTSNYTQNVTYPGWIYDVWYEVDVKLSALGSAGFGAIAVTGIESSPSKIGSTTETVSEGPCCEIEVTIIGIDSVCAGGTALLTSQHITNIEATVIATEDTYLSQASSNTNYGSCNRLYTGLSSSSRARSLIKFNLSTIASTTNIVSAKLVMTKTGGSNTSATSIGVHRVTNSWTENTGSCSGSSYRTPTWNKRTSTVNWTTSGGDYNATAESVTTVSSNAVYEWDVTNLVKAWVNGTYTNNGLMLKRVTEGTINQKYFASSEYTTVTSRPRLEIIYEGEPVAAIVEWSNGQIGSSISVTPATNTIYTAVVHDINNCGGTGTKAVRVDPRPTASISGSNLICKDSVTTLSPATGGTWTSSNSAVATVTNEGVVTGKAAGNANFTFTNSATTCQSEPTSSITVINSPVVNLTGSSSICIGSTTTLSPNAGGTWTSSNPSVATVNNSGLVTAVSDGTATFYFIDATTGCKSNSTVPITVMPRPTVSITGSDSICLNSTTTLSPNSGGTWVSELPAIASVATNGLVTGISAGTATFVFTNSASGCSSNPTSAVTINPKPSISFTGPSAICVGSTTTMSPSSGGTWTSSNPVAAIIDNSGLVSGLSAGTSFFTFTSSITGCQSDASSSITVNARPIVSIMGSASICVGATTSLSPSTGGTWTSNSPAIASVTNDGIATGVASGSTTFTFTQSSTGCTSNATNSVIINARPLVSITGPTSVCLGDSTTISPTNGGTWESSNSAIATVTDDGKVKGITPGTAVFTFTLNSNGCVSLPTGLITVNALPVASVTGGTSICVGTTTTLSPSTGGIWISSNATVAHVTNAGIVTGISSGSATFVFTQSLTGCISPPSGSISVNPKPLVNISGSSTICEGSTTTISPSNGGIWLSNDPLVASVTNAGLVTGLSGGSTTFTFYQFSTGCSSNSTLPVTINARPISTISGPDLICLGGTSTLAPDSEGTWTSSNPAVASVTNEGLVTALSPGTSTFTFTQNSTGCLSVPTALMTIQEKPAILLTGPTDICIGNTTSFLPATSGTWVSSNPAVASISNDGIVTGLSAGLASFVFTHGLTLCHSDESTIIQINPKPVIQVDGLTVLCAGETSSLTPSAGGTWLSNDPSIASIDNTGTITGNLQGTTNFAFTDANTGCSSDISADFTINDLPVVSITGTDSLCIQGTTNLFPAFGGIWTSSDPSVASVDVSGEVTGISGGKVVFTFKDANTLCNSEPTDTILVNSSPGIVLTGPASICIGTNTGFSPSGGGIWTSNNPAIASIDSFGLVTGLAEGSVTFKYNQDSTGCFSDSSIVVYVMAKPTISISGPLTICEGTNTTLSPTTGGTWQSSDSLVASVADDGLVLGKGNGTVTFIFTQASTGCESDSSLSVNVIARPIVTILGSDSICVAATTQLSPAIGGTWVSGDPLIAEVDNFGTVTGLAEGTTNFTFTNTSTGCISLPTPNLVFNNRPMVSITGNLVICEGLTTTLFPTTGGVWLSSDTAIATVAPDGTVTGTGGGVATFTFTAHFSNCPSNPTGDITVDAKPVTNITGPSILCLGDQTTITPSIGGTWVSSNPSVATITNAGVVSSISEGQVYFEFTQTSTGCTSDPTLNISVYEIPVAILTGSDVICQENTTSVSPVSGGIWTSSNPSIASVSADGIVTGLQPGRAVFAFTPTISGCVSNFTDSIIVNEKPIALFVGSDTICEGLTTSLIPNSGGTWVSSDPAVATITDFGDVSGIGAGLANFTFTNSATGCISDISNNILVYEKPGISLSGLNEICEGASTNMLPFSGGTWISSDVSIATISNTGLVTGLSDGSVNFTYLETQTGCFSDASDTIIVHEIPVVSITGPPSACVGSTTTLSPSTGGTWASSHPGIADVSTDGVVIGLSAGFSQFIFTSDYMCISSPTANIEILELPVVTLTGSDTLCKDQTSMLIPANGGTWHSTNPAVAAVTNGGQITAVSEGNSDFYFIDTLTGCASNTSLLVAVNPEPAIFFTGPQIICVGSNTSLSPSSGGIWESSDPSVALVDNLGEVTALADGTSTFSFTDTITGCPSDTSATLVVNGNPTVGIDGPAIICVGSTTNLVAGISGNWVSSNPAIATVNSSGVVTGVSNGTVDFTFHSAASGCPSDQISGIVVNSQPTVTIDFNGSVCVSNNTQLSAVVSGGTSPYSYNWSGPNSFSANSQFISITTNGNYQVTVSDDKGCTTTNNGYIHEIYQPLIVTLQPEVCQGTSVTLTASGANAVSYQWGANAGNATTQAVSVLPVYPSSTYIVTVTNDLGCSSTATTTIIAKQTPTVNITGQDTICTGDTTNLNPAVGGTWQSSNNGVATVTNSGLVTGFGVGTAIFTFTLASSGCNSLPTAPIRVNNNPQVAIVGPSSVCIGSSTSLSPSTGGSWSSSNASIASVSSAGTVTGIAVGYADFTFISDTTGCASTTDSIDVDGHEGSTISGDNSLCVGDNSVLSASKPGGTWSSSNSSIASINATGLVTAHVPGQVTITYTRNTGACVNQSTFNIGVSPIPSISISGSPTICAGATTSLSPVSGGTWSSGDVGVATVDNEGIVTGVQAGSTTFVFTNSTTGCISLPSNPITILSKPVVAIIGPSSICKGLTTQLTPVSGGAWTSSNNAVASITSGGVVTGITSGSVTFIFTLASNGCSSDPSLPISVNERPTLSIQFNGSQCLTDSSALSVSISGGTAPFNYNWTGPSFSSSAAANNIQYNGTYYLTVTDQNLCSSTSSAIVYERYLPVIVAPQSTICEGESQLLSINASSAVSYLWSASAGDATTTTVSVTPAVPATLYSVTVTSIHGCTASASSTINVNTRPVVSFNGPTTLCAGQTTLVLPSSGGVWVSSNPSIASVSSSGFIQALSQGTATFSFTNSGTGCASAPSTPIAVSPKPIAIITGPTALCVGNLGSLSPASGGVWTSLNPTAASVSNAGIITALASGTASFIFTSSATSCASDPTAPITINPKPGVSFTGPATLCLGGSTALTPSTGGTWSSANPAIASITNGGIVSAISAGTTNFIFTQSSTGCSSNVSPSLAVFGKPTISISGDSVLCAGESSLVTSSEAGTWASSNTSVASVTNAGVILGTGPGLVVFTFTSTATGCSSNPSQPVLINPTPVVNIIGPNAICINSQSQLTPSSGGTWTSNEPAIAAITNVGLVTGLSQGSASFKFTDASTGCISANSVPIVVYAKPVAIISGPQYICIGSNTTLQPSSGGIWTSGNTAVAVVSSSGIVTGLSEGSARFVYIESVSGCISDSTDIVYVGIKPTATLTGPTTLCIQETSTAFPSSGGVWISSNPSIASINSLGIITAQSQGQATFTFHPIGGCPSNPIGPVTVNGKPTISTNAGANLCPGQNIQLYPSSDGNWTSGNTSVATIDATGVANIVNQGTTKFIYQSGATGCYSDSTSLFIVHGRPTAGFWDPQLYVKAIQHNLIQVQVEFGRSAMHQ